MGYRKYLSKIKTARVQLLARHGSRTIIEEIIIPPAFFYTSDTWLVELSVHINIKYIFEGLEHIN